MIIGTDEGRFSIFLIKKEIPSDKVYDLEIDLKELKIRRFPLLDDRDLISYSLKTHTMRLAPEKWEKIMKLEVGTLFVVCVGRKPIYWGIIWTSGYSVSFSGIVIDRIKELMTLSSSQPIDYWFRIECGYPSEKFFLGNDLRSDERIVNALRRSGKLIEKE
jgi:hypothetical protein